jgi:NADH dehydrogenase, FAD-containing subunit
MQKIIIIGGGAGGLELATDLGDKLGKTDKAQITLVDKNSYHLWKPLLHEVATGVLDEQVDNIYYASQGQQHNFEFTQGTFTDLDRDRF